jgi:hypothetical protein
MKNIPNPVEHWKKKETSRVGVKHYCALQPKNSVSIIEA